MRKLAIWLNWANFSEYHSQQLAEAIGDQYQTTITYRPLDWAEYDLVMPFFPGPNRQPDCERKKIVKFVWEPHELGWAHDAGTVCVASTPVREWALKRYPECILLPWGVNPAHFQPAARHRAHGPVVVGWAGHPDNPRKRFGELEAALADVQGLEFRPNKTHMREGQQLGAYDLPGIADYYHDIDVYACASYREGFGFPLLEAAACGRAIVSFDVGIACDLKNSGAGVVIAKDFDEMVEALLNADLDELGLSSGRAVAEHWTWDVLGDRWLEVFNHAG